MTADVAIVGAGIIGCAVARRLARDGVSVVVVDRDEPGRHASWAAAGMLAPQAETDRSDDFLQLLLRSRELFPSLAADLKEETGLDVGYRTEGLLNVALTEADERLLAARYLWQRDAGLAVEKLTAEEAWGLEPMLSPAARCALFFPGDHQVDNRVLVRALWFSAHAAGARFVSGVAVRRIERGDGGFRLELGTGDFLEAEKVVLAAGSWSGEIEGLPRELPVEPVHGQLIGLETAPPLLRHLVGTERGYLVPRADGRLIVGATVERVGFRTAVTPAGLKSMTDVALEIAPALHDHRVYDHWSGLRPGTPDDLPILGPDPESPDLFYATGHFRNGILLAPVTAELIAALAQGKEAPIDIDAFRVDRFGKGD